jgi:prephenate dehydrogenase
LHVAVAGLGLIGGSVALAARERCGARVTGTDPDPAAVAAARAAGAIEAEGGVDEADVVVVAAPVAALAGAVADALAVARPDAVVTDVGSTKGPLVAAVDEPRFVAGHPLAGGESAGIAHARADLFAGATWYLVPGPRSSGVAFERVHRFLAALGARPVAIDPETHDRVMAAVSHLPHVLANVLVAQAAQALGGEAMPATGPSFRDATRVAGANPPLWAQIYAGNAAALGAQLDAVIARLADVRTRLHDLEGWQAEAAAHRRALLETGLEGGPVQEVRVPVPNRPGVVADLALTLGRAGINIADMSLSPAPDMTEGVVALWVAEADAARARALISERGLPAA